MNKENTYKVAYINKEENVIAYAQERLVPVVGNNVVSCHLHPKPQNKTTYRIYKVIDVHIISEGYNELSRISVVGHNLIGNIDAVVFVCRV